MNASQIVARRARAGVMRRAGSTLKEIAAALGVSQATVRIDLIAAGEWRGGQPRITERTREVAGMYLQGGTTMQAVGAAFGISAPCVHHHVAKYLALSGGNA